MVAQPRRQKLIAVKNQRHLRTLIQPPKTATFKAQAQARLEFGLAGERRHQLEAPHRPRLRAWVEHRPG